MNVENYQVEKAKEIHRQLVTLTSRSVIWSWGASAFRAVTSDQIEGLGHSYECAMLFYVRGLLHKGHVLVSLQWDDTYTVSVGHLRKNKFNVKAQKPYLHFHEFSQAIDEMVERKSQLQVG